MNDDFLHRRLDVGEITMHVAEARPANHEDAPLVVFMHGFPELWWSWRKQLIAFRDAGYWAVAPDMRGYNETDKPKAVSDYEVEKLAADIDGLVKALGRKKAIIVAHDWGAVVAWVVAERYPEMVERLAILNVPHALSMMRGFKNPKQLLKSWYIWLFQLPMIPERLMPLGDFKVVRDMFEDDGIPADDIEPYIDALKKPGATTAMMNYYRASIRRVIARRPPKVAKIECPVLVIWGDRDRALMKELADPPKRFVPNARVVHIPEATHWVQNVAPEKVNELLLEFTRAEA